MNNLKLKRNSSGLTQCQFAQKIGVPIRTYMRYESAKTSTEYREPKATTAIKIAKALNTTVEEIWTDTNSV